MFIPNKEQIKHGTVYLNLLFWSTFSKIQTFFKVEGDILIWFCCSISSKSKYILFISGQDKDTLLQLIRWTLRKHCFVFEALKTTKIPTSYFSHAVYLKYWLSQLCIPFVNTVWKKAKQSNPARETHLSAKSSLFGCASNGCAVIP